MYALTTLFSLALALEVTAAPKPASAPPTANAVMYEYGHGQSASTTLTSGVGAPSTPPYSIDDPAASWLAEHPDIQKPSSYDWQSLPPSAQWGGATAISSASPSVPTNSEVPPVPSEPIASSQPVVPSQPVASSQPLVPTNQSVPSQPVQLPPSSSVHNGAASTPLSTAKTRTVGVSPTHPTSGPPVDTGTASGAPSSVLATGAGGTAVSSSAASPAQTGGCECGYRLTEYQDRYYPESLVVDFSTVADGTPLSELGFTVVNGDPAGSPAEDGSGRRCNGSADNVWVEGGVLHLKVPGGQPKSGVNPIGAELVFNTPVTGGLFSMDAIVDAGVGTCQSIFTYSTNDELYKDEIDIEVLGHNLADQGMGLSSYNPDGTKDGIHTQFPNDPTADYNWYTIGWFKDAPQFFYNRQMLQGPNPTLPVNPSSIIINNWSNGDPAFTQGPPDQDNILRVRKIEYYYQTEAHNIFPALKTGCTAEGACPVGPSNTSISQ